MNPLQIFSQPRHLRSIYFVDTDLPYTSLLGLVKENLAVWGGRYNPIIPVAEGVIDAGYRDLIQHYDPDYIYHSGSVPREAITQLRLFNPVEYINLDATPRTHVQSLSSIYQTIDYPPQYSILVGQELYNAPGSLLEYYKVNFGLRTNQFVGETEVLKGREQIRVGVDFLGKVHDTIYQRKPIDRTLLASTGIDTVILRTERDAPYDSFEIVLARDTTSTKDLFYYWNRHLCQCHRVFYMTVEQLREVKGDPFFGPVLADLSGIRMIDVVSLSLSDEEVGALIQSELKPLVPQRRFRQKKVESFPFNVMDDKGLYMPGNRPKPDIRTLGARESLLLMPDFPFRSDAFFHPQAWAVDLEIRELREQGQKLLKFPLTTDARRLLQDATARVTMDRRLAYIMGPRYPRQQTVGLALPPFHQQIRQMLSSPLIDGTRVDSPYQYIARHDASNRLASFIQLFGENFETIDEYFSDKLWHDLFVQMCRSGKADGDTITLSGLVARVAGLMKESGYPLGSASHPWRNEESLTLGLMKMLEELTALTVLLPGHVLKCPRCSTKNWYSLDQVTTRIRCQSCLVDFDFPIEPRFAYRLNGLVQKNMFQSPTQPDGNLTVIRTLSWLSGRARGEFLYSPQLNLYSAFGDAKPVTDLDLIGMAAGKLSIGEAKHDSAEFSKERHKALHALADIANAIRPDEVILACTVDASNKLERARAYLENLFRSSSYQPVVTAHLVAEPTYDLGGGKYYL